MAMLTVRLSDEKHQRLKALAKSRGISLNRLIGEMVTQMLAEFDAEIRFLIRAERPVGFVAYDDKAIEMAIEADELVEVINDET